MLQFCVGIDARQGNVASVAHASPMCSKASPPSSTPLHLKSAGNRRTYESSLMLVVKSIRRTLVAVRSNDRWRLL
jgi:hypothetical protein